MVRAWPPTVAVGMVESWYTSFQNTVDLVTEDSSPPLSVGDMFQDSQGMPKTSDSTEPYIYYI